MNEATKALFAACREGELDALLAAIAAGADVNARDADGCCPLQRAIWADPDDRHGFTDADPTMAACFLAEAGADVNTKVVNIYGGRMVSAEWTMIDLAIHSICDGLDPNPQVPNPDMGYEAAAQIQRVAENYRLGRLSTFAFGDATSLLFYRVQDGDLADAKIMLAAHADPNVRADDDSTPLHHARDAETVQCLIAAGADVHARDQYDSTPLFGATASAARALLAADADVHARNCDGCTPLHFASSRDEVVLLINAGAIVDARDDIGMTPLHHARNVDVRSALIACGADVNARCESHFTPAELWEHEEKSATPSVDVRLWRRRATVASPM